MSRRGALALLLVLGMTAVAWFAVESLLRVDRHRPWLEDEVARITGLPASIEELDLRLLPVPRLSVLTAQVGSGDASVTAGRVDLIPDLRALLGGRIVLRSIEILDLTLTVPEDAEQAQSVWALLRGRLEAELAKHRDTESAASVEVEYFGAREVRFKRGAEVIALANLSAHRIATGTEFGLELNLEALQATLAGEALLADVGSETHLTGALRILGLRTDVLGDLPETLRAAVTGTIEVEGNPEQALRFVVDTTLDPDSAQGPRGALKGQVDLRLSDTPSLDFALEADGFEARGSMGSAADGDPWLQLEELDAQGAALGLLFASLEESPLSLGGEAARLRAAGWRAALPSGAAPKLEAGQISIQQLDVAWGAKRLPSPWHLQGEVEEGVFRIDSLGSRAVELNGRVEPDAGFESMTLRLGGSVELEPELLALFADPTTAPELRGRIVIDELHASLPSTPNALVLRAHLRDGAASFAGEAYRDSIRGIDLDLEGRDGRWEVSGRGRSERLGELDLSVHREADSSLLDGVLGLDASALVGLLPKQGSARQLAPLLREFGRSRLLVQIQPPAADATEIEIRLERRETPRLKAKLALPMGSDGDGLGEVDALIQIPAAALRGALPDSLTLGGRADLHLQRLAGERRFVAKLDAKALRLTLAPWLDKAVGEPLQLTLRGAAEPAGWEAREITIAASAAEARFLSEGERWVARGLALDLAAWSTLLPEGARAAGRLEGAILTGPLRADLRLTGAGLSPSPEVALPMLDGALTLDASLLRARSLRVRGPDTDFSLDAERTDETISGQIQGASLNLDYLLDWTRAFASLGPQQAQLESASRFGALSGQIGIALDSLHAGRSEARQLRAQVQLAEGGLRIDPLVLETYEGHVSGSVAMPATEGLTVSLEIRDVTGRFLDDLVFAEKPRGIRGVFGGTLLFDAPRGRELRPMLASASGSLLWSASKGSFGQLGLATRLIAVLRASEVLRLKLPSIRDEGLVFDSVESSLSMQQGRMSVDRFQLESAVYAITASGSVDFAADRTSLPIEFDAIRGLSAILQPIPIAGDALKIAHVRLVATGSPYDMKIGVASFRDQIVGASTAVPRATIGRIRDALELLKPVPGATPDPSPPPPAPAPEALPSEQPQEPAAEPARPPTEPTPAGAMLEAPEAP